MVTIIKRSEIIETEHFAHSFDRGDGSGYSFSCSQHGLQLIDGPYSEVWAFVDSDLNITLASPNYEFATIKIASWNDAVANCTYKGVVTYKSTYVEPMIVRCGCGNHVTLHRDAEQCEKCGQYFSLFGQPLAPPSQWEPEERYDTFGPQNGADEWDL